MATNVVCSDTYIDAFSRLDKKTQKKSLEAIRLMQRSLKSNSLKIEKLNTKLNFKSARITQDFRVIFTQYGNTVLLVYIAHHDDAYLWASKRLQKFDVSDTKSVYEYFEQSKAESESMVIEPISQSSKKSGKSKKGKSGNRENALNRSDIQADCKTTDNNARQSEQNSVLAFFKKFLFALFFFLLGTILGTAIAGTFL